MTMTERQWEHRLIQSTTEDVQPLIESETGRSTNAPSGTHSRCAVTHTLLLAMSIVMCTTFVGLVVLRNDMSELRERFQPEPAASICPAPSSSLSPPARYLLILSTWERLASAVVALGEVLDAVQVHAPGVKVIVPSVQRGELGTWSNPNDLLDQPFSTYFDIPVLQQAAVPIASLDEFTRDVGVVIRTTPVVPVDLLVVVDYAGGVQDYDATGMSACNTTHIGRLDFNRRSVLLSGLLFSEVVCIRAPLNLTVALQTLYSKVTSSGAAVRSVAVHQYRRVGRASLAADHMFDAFASRFMQHLDNQSWFSDYAVIQMRAGLYLRCGALGCRADAPAKMSRCAERLINATRFTMRRQGIVSVVVAADIYGALPEAFDGGENYTETFTRLQEMFVSAFGSSLVRINIDSLDPHGVDPVGTSSIMDFLLAVGAKVTLAMNTNVGRVTSVYTQKIVEARERRKKLSIQVSCEPVE